MSDPSSNAATSTKVVVATTVALSFISFWRGAAIVLSDLGSTMFYVGGIAEKAIGESAAWFVLAVMFCSSPMKPVEQEESYSIARQAPAGPFLLLEQPGQIVSREELQRHLWQGTTFVDFEQGLNTVVNKLRQALGDSADRPRYVETFPGKGYRFIAPVQRAAPKAVLEMAPAALRIEPKPQERQRFGCQCQRL